VTIALLFVLNSIPGVDVMITIFCDFCQFSAKNWRFPQKLAVVWAKNANIFVKFFAENIYIIKTSFPGIHSHLCKTFALYVPTYLTRPSYVNISASNKPQRKLMDNFRPDSKWIPENQGDQMGRIFAYGVVVYLDSILKNLRLLFPTIQVMYQIWQKTGWAMFVRFFHKLIWSPWWKLYVGYIPLMSEDMSCNVLVDHGLFFTWLFQQTRCLHNICPYKIYVHTYVMNNGYFNV
jgi:hypothetical protein